jgi:hypothetical protein
MHPPRLQRVLLLHASTEGEWFSDLDHLPTSVVGGCPTERK